MSTQYNLSSLRSTISSLCVYYLNRFLAEFHSSSEDPAHLFTHILKKGRSHIPFIDNEKLCLLLQIGGPDIPDSLLNGVGFIASTVAPLAAIKAAQMKRERLKEKEKKQNEQKQAE